MENKKYFFEWLEEKKIKFNEDEINNKITTFYKNLELITLNFKKNPIEVINPNEVLFYKFLKGKDKNIENIKIYLDEYIKKIEVESNDEDEDEIEIYTPDFSGYTVRELPTSMGFKTLMDYVDRDLLIIPKNQRNYVWTRDQVENLAISLLRGFPIPPIYTYRNKKNQLVILDGQQRLISLYLYSKDRFLRNTSKTPIDLREILNSKPGNESGFLEELRELFGLREENFYLAPLNKRGEKIEITYSKLDEETKRIVDFRSINLIEIMVQGNGNHEEIYYEIFGNLNQGGTQLKNQELRNGIYQCKFYDMLHEINNENKKWREIFGPKHKHSRDVELLLRFIATEYMFEFKENNFILEKHTKGNRKIDGFKSSYPKLLNDFSKIAMDFSDDEIKEFRKKIELFLKRIEKNENTKIFY